MNVVAVLKDAGLESTLTIVSDETRLKKEEIYKIVAEHSAMNSSNGPTVITEM